MLSLALGSLALAPSPAVHSRCAALAPTPAIRCLADGGDLAVVKRLNDAFWAQKRARIEAETEQKLRELDEYEARERALGGMASSGASGELGAMELALLQEQAKVAALEAELAEVRALSEVNVQKTAAFWIAKLADAKQNGALPAAAEPAAAEPASAPAPDLVPSSVKLVDSSTSLRELRARLLGFGLSTVGLKSELVDRLEVAMQGERQKYSSWDTAAQKWL